jgi:ribosomal protein S18 acetylase RimI-like enzyme
MIEPACREATASTQDLQHVALLAETAARGLFAALLGPGWATIFANVARHPGHDLSHDKAHFLTVEGEVAGLMSGYSAAQKQAEGNRSMWLMARYGWPQLPRLIVHGLPRLPLMRWHDDLPADAFYIALLALYPAYRRRGLSRPLLDIAHQQAQIEGCAQVALDVATDNPAAIAAYRSYGFRITGTSPVVRVAGTRAAVHRMIYPINQEPH